MRRLIEDAGDIFQGPNSWGDCLAVERDKEEIRLWINGHMATMTAKETETLVWFLKQAIANQMQ